MDDDVGGGSKFHKKSSADKGGEVDCRTKSGTAWSHNFLNQKPWHPLSYPNQRRKWIAEQTHAQKERRAEEVSKEYAQEQEFLRQTALISQKEKEKLEIMKAVSFMYVKPPGYNAESAKAAEIAEQKKNQEQGPSLDGPSPSTEMENNPPTVEKKKARPKDLYGRALPTEEQFEILKNAPRLDTGVIARARPFGLEIRNVKCLRCGNFGHQSGDRECPLKDAIMPNEESRLKRDDPLTTIQAQTESSEPLKWELKQTPGMSPPRGGFDADDPNQQIVAEDIFDEYGGFLGEAIIPELLTNFSSTKTKKKSSRKSKHKRRSKISDDDRGKGVPSSSSSGDDKHKRSKKKKRERKNRNISSSESSEDDRYSKRRNRHKNRNSYSSDDTEAEEPRRSRHENRSHHRDRHRHRP